MGGLGGLKGSLLVSSQYLAMLEPGEAGVPESGIYIDAIGTQSNASFMNYGPRWTGTDGEEFPHGVGWANCEMVADASGLHIVVLHP